MTPHLELRGATFGFAGRTVIHSASFALEQGTATALVGANGIGKTTLLRVASGGIVPSAGEVRLDGASLTGMKQKEIARRLALVPQRLEVPFRFTVEQIVEQGRTPHIGALRGLLREDRIAVDQAMERADVATLRARIFNELSGGERQRVKIALGLSQLARPESSGRRLLLLDEPTQNLDIGRQVELMDLLASLRSEGITLLVSIHDLALVRGNFSRVLLMGGDNRIIDGPADSVMTPDNLEWAFDCPPGRHPMLHGDRVQ
jgi:iron complex transport system ATP-binding protein